MARLKVFDVYRKHPEVLSTEKTFDFTINFMDFGFYHFWVPTIKLLMAPRFAEIDFISYPKNDFTIITKAIMILNKLQFYINSILSLLPLSKIFSFFSFE